MLSERSLRIILRLWSKDVQYLVSHSYVALYDALALSYLAWKNILVYVTYKRLSLYPIGSENITNLPFHDISDSANHFIFASFNLLSALIFS